MGINENLTSKRTKIDGDYLLNDVLPKHVVIHILSLLPTKEAVKTSILSKRWRNWWTGISNLDFSDENEVSRAYESEDGHSWIDEGNRSGVGREKFIKYVNNVMLRRDPTCSIDKFSIVLCVYPDVLEIKKWISLAAKYNVKDLSLRLDTYCQIDICVPLKVFGCKSLEALRLYGLHLKFPKRGFVGFPNLKFLSLDRHVWISGIPAKGNSPCFPNLKTLHLTMVRYLGRNDCVMKLIRNCPNLEDLKIHRAIEHNVSNVDMCIPQLASVELFCGIGRYNGPNVRIKAPIKYLKITYWNPTHKITVKNPDSLIRAELDFGFSPEEYHFQGEQGDKLFKILKTVGNVKCLTLPFNASDAIKASGMKLPLLSSVTQLEVTLQYKDLCMLECYLNSTINLQILVVHRSRSGYIQDGDDVPWPELSPAPKCLESSIKKIEISNAFDCHSELNMIKFMLNSAKSVGNAYHIPLSFE